MQPKGVLIDYGGTLVEEVEFNPRAGNEWLLSRAAYRPPQVTLDDVMARADRVTKEIAARRDQFQLETPWPTITRLMHDFFGIRFEEPMAELEVGFWKAAVKTRPMPWAREALEELHRCGIPFAVVSNCSYGQTVIRYELGRHGLADLLAFVMVSAEYAVRKPNVLLFEVAAARLGVKPEEIWCVGDRLDADVTGAKAAKMTAVWFQPSKGEAAGGADLIVSDWRDFMNRFQQSRRH